MRRRVVLWLSWPQEWLSLHWRYLCWEGMWFPWYKYLGIWFNDDWSWDDHVEYVILRAERAVGEFEFRFWKNRAVDIETKVIAWKSMFRPALEYGSEV